MPDYPCSAAPSAARRRHNREVFRPNRVPERAKERIINTARGPIIIWYWRKPNGLWNSVYQGQQHGPTTIGGLPTAVAAWGRAGKEARAFHGRAGRQTSQALRFAILERDNFTCQYCGRFAPEVILQVDHVVPKSLGGSNDPENLVTACRDCNLGKSNRAVFEEAS